MEKTSQDRILYLLKSQGPQMARDIAADLEVTTPGAQQKLAKLAEMELISFKDRIHGKGRPHRFWELTDRGHARFPDRHSDLTLDILQSTEEVFGKEGVEALISHREKQTLALYSAEIAKKKTLPERLKALVEIRSREGYMAEVETLGKGEYRLIENHCPICAAATKCQGLCRSELDIFRMILGPEAQVEREDHILAGARRCAYRITI
ncbi:MAG: transcriptional regulator [Proteobacteria bacterium]|nr:transcriptional regulator [Pseudomonadota bacterium]